MQQYPSSAQTARPDRVPAIHREFEQAEGQCEKLQKTIDSLFERLGPITGPNNPLSADHLLNKVAELRSPIAERLSAHNQELAGITERIRDLIERLEI